MKKPGSPKVKKTPLERMLAAQMASLRRFQTIEEDARNAYTRAREATAARKSVVDALKIAVGASTPEAVR